MIKALAPQKEIHFSRNNAIEWFAQNYPDIKDGTILAHLIRFSTNAPSRLHYSVKSDEDLLFQVENNNFRLYDPSKDPTPIHSKADVLAQTQTTESQESDETPTLSEFAYESDLRDFLAKNLSLIEPNLSLYKDDEGITGIEFPVGGRFIDILAIDANKHLVVIELKVSKGYDRVIGQILRYMAWIKKHHAIQGQGVRGIIAAREISEDLKLVCSYLPDVALYEYELSVVLKKIQIDAISD
jgi:hypothetical protein